MRVEHARLREAVTRGTFADLCELHDLDLVVVFGSVFDPETDPRDLDIAVQFGHGDGAHDTLGLINDLYELTGSERVDLLVLNRAASLVRERALTTGEPLFQRKPGGFANAQIAAIMERLDTDRFRAMDLELMSS